MKSKFLKFSKKKISDNKFFLPSKVMFCGLKSEKNVSNQLLFKFSRSKQLKFFFLKSTNFSNFL